MIQYPPVIAIPHPAPRQATLTPPSEIHAFVGWAPGPPRRRSPQKLASNGGVCMIFCGEGGLISRAMGQGPTLLAQYDFDEQKRFRRGTQAAQVIDYFAENFHNP